MKGLNRPSLNEIRETIREIGQLDLTVCEIEDIAVLLNQIGVGYTQKGLMLEPGTLLYRAIPYSSKPTHASYLSYPPEAFAKAGRVSRKGNPVFYSATDYRTSIWEIGLKPGDKFVMTRWVVQKEIQLTNVGFMPETYKRLKSNGFRPVVDQVIDRKNIYSGHRNNLALHKYLADQFCRPVSKDQTHLYKLTTAIAEFVMYDGWAGLAYPTMAMRGNGENVVLKTEIIDLGIVSPLDVLWAEIIEEIPDEINPKFKGRTLDCARHFTTDKFIVWGT